MNEIEEAIHKITERITRLTASYYSEYCYPTQSPDASDNRLKIFREQIKNLRLIREQLENINVGLDINHDFT